MTYDRDDDRSVVGLKDEEGKDGRRIHLKIIHTTARFRHGLRACGEAEISPEGKRLMRIR